MKNSVIEILTCPTCKSSLYLSEDGKSCFCKGLKKHCFDFSKSGYLNLGGSHAGDGDSKDAILSRRRFLDAGYYQILSDRLLSILDELPSQTILDAGCGEGYYTNRIHKERTVLGVDLSRAGIDYAARRAKQLQNGTGFAVASIFGLPVADQSLDVILNLFAPCAEDEFSRALKSGGHLVLVGAGGNHLMGLKKAIYDNPYQNSGRADLPTNLKPIHKETLRDSICVNGRDLIEALFSMTPYYWRTSPKDREKLTSMEELKTDIEFDIFIYRKEA